MDLFLLKTMHILAYSPGHLIVMRSIKYYIFNKIKKLIFKTSNILLEYLKNPSTKYFRGGIPLVPGANRLSKIYRFIKSFKNFQLPPATSLPRGVGTNKLFNWALKQKAYKKVVQLAKNNSTSNSWIWLNTLPNWSTNYFPIWIIFLRVRH